MRDRVNVVILMVGIALMVGMVIGVKASEVLHRTETAAEIAVDRYVGTD